MDGAWKGKGPSPFPLALCSQSGAHSLEAPLRVKERLSPPKSPSGSGGMFWSVWAGSSLPTPWGPSFSEAPTRVLLSTPTALMEFGKGEQPRLRPRLELFCNHIGFTKAPHISCPRHPLSGCVSPYVPGQMCAVCPGCICN